MTRAECFLEAAEGLFTQVCALCAELCRTVATDPTLLELAACARPGQFEPLLLMVAAHHEILRDPTHELAEFYVSLAPSPRPPEGVGRVFRDFCRQRGDALRHLVATRAVQTTEVRRCALLLPLLALASDRAGGAPLAMLDLGTGAGLALLFDRYRYDYGAVRLGPADSPLVLECQVRGGTPPLRLPEIAWRAGLDLQPLDVTSAEDRAWMKAHLWPNTRFAERLARLEAALGVAVASPPPVRRADMVASLPDVLEEMPPDATACLVHCFSFYELPAEARAELEARIEECARRRPLLVVGMEWNAREGAWLEVRDPAAGWQARVGVPQVHGEWLEWTV